MDLLLKQFTQTFKTEDIIKIFLKTNKIKITELFKEN